MKYSLFAIFTCLLLSSVLAWSGDEVELTHEQIDNRQNILNSMLNGSIEDLFKKYIELYAKDYTFDSDEGKSRLINFNTNVENIKKHNQDQTLSWKIGIDQYSDMSKDEFRKNVLMKTESLKKNLGYYLDAEGLDTIEYVTNKAEINFRNIDYSSKTGKVFNQKNCGCCYAMANTNAIETNYSLETGEYFVHYSRQQTVDCSVYTSGCSGGDDRLMIAYANKDGLIPDENYPFTSTNGIEGACKYESLKFKTKKVVTGFERNNEHINKDNCGKSGLFDTLTRGVVTIAIDGDIINGYKGGLLDLRNKCANLNHAVLLVGYQKNGNEEYWLAKNSWGTDWGEKGYLRIKVQEDNDMDFEFNCYTQCGFTRPFFKNFKY